MPITLHPPTGAPAPDLAGKTLVVPAATVGNVGQLACDLLVTTLALPSAAHALSPHLLPAAGRDAVGDGGVATEAQLYGGGGAAFAVLHTRAPPLPGRARAWQDDVAALASSCKAARILVLASVDAAARRDAHLGAGGAPVPVVGVAAGGAALPPGVPALPPDAEHDTPRAARRLPPWGLLAAAEAGACPPVLALLCYASDGDNAADAAALASAAAAALALDPVPPAWKAPAAWGAAFGAAAGVV